MIKYEVIIYWSEEDAVFTAERPDLQSCAAHGTTQEDALTNALDAIRLVDRHGEGIWRSDPGTEGSPPDSGLTARA